MAFPFGAWTLPTFVPLLRLHTDDVENRMEHGRMLLPEIVADCGILVFVEAAQYEAQNCVLRRATHFCTSVKLQVMKAIGQGLYWKDCSGCGLLLPNVFLVPEISKVVRLLGR